jgi:hypothetical protein
VTELPFGKMVRVVSSKYGRRLVEAQKDAGDVAASPA